MIDKKELLEKCPSNIHKDFLAYAYDFFTSNHCKAILKGSVYKKTAHKYSDIDLVIKEIDKDTIQQLIYGFGDVALISRTQRPLGIIIVVYCNGLSLDLDFRETVLQDELDNSDSLGNPFEKEDISTEIIRCSNVLELDDKGDWDNMQRLFHRSIIKWLGGNKALGNSILDEIITFLSSKTNIELDTNNDFKEKYKRVLAEYNRHFEFDSKYYNVLDSLLKDIPNEK